MTLPSRNINLQTDAGSSRLEWIVTNGLGGYASSAVSGRPTRRYHGLLVSAHPPPIGRMLFLSDLTLLVDGEPAPLAEFVLDAGLPVWRFQASDRRWTIEKRVLMPHGQNTVYVTVRALASERPIRVQLTPFVHLRPPEMITAFRAPDVRVRSLDPMRAEISQAEDLPLLRWRLDASRGAWDWTETFEELHYTEEAARGFQFWDRLQSPGRALAELCAGDTAAFVASTESWSLVDALGVGEVLEAELKRRRYLVSLAAPVVQTDDRAAELVLAADQFIVRAPRQADAAKAAAIGEEAMTIYAGYHWFTDWGRDTMISLEGLTLSTGRAAAARSILHTFASHARDGLIPNLFPEAAREGLYHTADATLWFFHAIDRYTRRSGDAGLIEELLPTMVDVFAHHMRGTTFGIGVDPADGLLTQGAPGYALTWMDAKAGDWVVTPRRGKAVEINALWYNAAVVLAGWCRDAGRDADAQAAATAAARARESFNRRFWNSERRCLFDVVDGEHGDSASVRPNQLFAISLPNPVLDESHWRDVLDVVRDTLVTPVGLRSLAPDDPGYQPKYDGDLLARDAAYHQGTVWAWLLGPYIDAWLKVAPSENEAVRDWLRSVFPHLDTAGVGSVAEIFDAEPPFLPRGCIAQAWSVAELLRCWEKVCCP